MTDIQEDKDIKKENPTKEGYLLLWEESGDEIHMDLITEKDYNRFVEVLGDSDTLVDIEYTPIVHWFSQTHCTDSWVFGNYKIL